MPDSPGKYVATRPWTEEEVASALQANDPKSLLWAVLGVAKHNEDWRFAQAICHQLSTHPDARVRGAAVEGFGHVARVHRTLDQAIVQPIIRAALNETHEDVRAHAENAKDDTVFFLKWHYEDEGPS